KGFMVGTPLYVAPEQARGKETDWRTDVYSLGVVAFELFLGQPPFNAESAIEIIGMHVGAIPPSPSRLWPEIPAALDRLLLRMLEKEPDGRPSLPGVEATLSAVRVVLRAREQCLSPTVPMSRLPPRHLGTAKPLLPAPPPPRPRRGDFGLVLGGVTSAAIA